MTAATEKDLPARSGEVFSYNRQPSRQVWGRARDPLVGQQILDESIALLRAKSLPTP